MTCQNVRNYVRTICYGADHSKQLFFNFCIVVSGVDFRKFWRRTNTYSMDMGAYLGQSFVEFREMGGLGDLRSWDKQLVGTRTQGFGMETARIAARTGGKGWPFTELFLGPQDSKHWDVLMYLDTRFIRRTKDICNRFLVHSRDGFPHCCIVFLLSTIAGSSQLADRISYRRTHSLIGLPLLIQPWP